MNIDFINLMKEMLSLGNVEEALTLGLRYIKDNDFSILKLRIARINRNYLKNEMSLEEREVETNKISNSLFELINDYEVKIIQANFHLLSGIDCMEHGEVETAIKEYSKAINLNSENALAYTYRGTCFLRLGLLLNAIQDFDTAIIKDPLHVNALKLRIKINLILGNEFLAYKDASTLKTIDGHLENELQNLINQFEQNQESDDNYKSS